MSMIATVIGNLTHDIEVRVSQAGKSWANVRMVSTTREKDRQSGEWKDSDPLYVSIPLFGEQAENAAASLSKGMRVIAVGRLKNRSYTDNQGQERVQTELVDCEAFGPDLRWATAQVTRKARAGGSQQGQGGGWGAPVGGSSSGAGFGAPAASQDFGSEQPF